MQTANLLHARRNHPLATRISDAGWAAFLSLLAFTAVCAGKRAVAVPPACTSQRCSGPNCGVLVCKNVFCSVVYGLIDYTALHEYQLSKQPLRC